MNPNLLGLNVYEHYIEARLTAGRGANTCVFAQLRVPAHLRALSSMPGRLGKMCVTEGVWERVRDAMDVLATYLTILQAHRLTEPLMPVGKGARLS